MFDKLRRNASGEARLNGPAQPRSCFSLVRPLIKLKPEYTISDLFHWAHFHVSQQESHSNKMNDVWILFGCFSFRLLVLLTLDRRHTVSDTWLTWLLPALRLLLVSCGCCLCRYRRWVGQRECANGTPELNLQHCTQTIFIFKVKCNVFKVCVLPSVFCKTEMCNIW